MRPLLKETKAVAALLQQGADSPEALANLVIEELDRVRGERTTYGVVMRMGEGKLAWYVGWHGFSTQNQAIKSIEKNPQASMATGLAVVPMRNPEGFEQLLAKIDAPPTVKGDFAAVAADSAEIRAGRKPKP